MTRSIILDKVALSFAQKVCFEDFSAEIHFGQRVAIIGRNGAGKSSLLNFIQGSTLPSRGEVRFPSGTRIGFLPQVISHFEDLSGGERVNKALGQVLAENPDILLLDEPTNHLDSDNRRSLLRMLQRYRGTLIIVTHDVEVLRGYVDHIWHIENGQISTFHGRYDEYSQLNLKKREQLERQLSMLQREKKAAHKDLMREQERAKKRRLHGEKKYDGDKLALRAAQGRGQLTSNKNRHRLGEEKKHILGELSGLKLPNAIKPKFHLSGDAVSLNRPCVQIYDGSCGYTEATLKNVNLFLSAVGRMRLVGKNGSGKTTLLKAILGDESVWRTGIWFTPKNHEIGYLDQHYATLDPNHTVIEVISNCTQDWSIGEIREHLNRFLFRKNEEVYCLVGNLSGGEKARLSLAQLAARTPKLLLLDEITNNLDLETREHVIEVLGEFPGAILLVSHDDDFAERLGVSSGDEYVLEPL